jgi:hypothetical protein
MSVHVFTEGWQPLTKYRDPVTERVIRVNPRKIYHCHECRDRRWAKWLKIQAYYDMCRIRCADGCYGENRNHRRSA